MNSLLLSKSQYFLVMVLWLLPLNSLLLSKSQDSLEMVLYGGPEGTSLSNKNGAISLKLCHPSSKSIVVLCVNLTVLYRNERLFLKNLRSFRGLSSASSVETVT